jgi:hypothetical protein
MRDESATLHRIVVDCVQSQLRYLGNPAEVAARQELADESVADLSRDSLAQPVRIAYILPSRRAGQFRIARRGSAR